MIIIALRHDHLITGLFSYAQSISSSKCTEPSLFCKLCLYWMFFAQARHSTLIKTCTVTNDKKNENRYMDKSEQKSFCIKLVLTPSLFLLIHFTVCHISIRKVPILRCCDVQDQEIHSTNHCYRLA